MDWILIIQMVWIYENTFIYKQNTMKHCANTVKVLDGLVVIQGYVSSRFAKEQKP